MIQETAADTADTVASNDGASTEPASAKHAPSIQRINFAAVIVAAVLAAIAIVMLVQLTSANAKEEATHERYEECVDATNDLMTASDYLTSQSRMYVVTGDVQYLDNYLEEINVTKSRDAAVETLERESGDAQAAMRLAEALQESNDLAVRELYAMRLTADATGVYPLPPDIAAVELDSADAALSAGEKRELANVMLLGTVYNDMKSLIIEDVDGCTGELISGLHQAEDMTAQTVSNLLRALIVIVIALVLIIAAAMLANLALVMRPMRVHAKNIQENEPLEPTGSQELLYVVNAYNEIYEENHRRTLLLKHQAETDALTGLLNRGSYDRMLKHPSDDLVLVLIDVDLFKKVNDANGHEVGDAVLKKVARAIDYHFRNTDYACRIGGDEFAVIMTEMAPGMHDVIVGKLQRISETLADTSDGLPPVTLSAGIAFSAEIKQGNIYHAADKAMYEAKHAGRNAYVFYTPELG